MLEIKQAITFSLYCDLDTKFIHAHSKPQISQYNETIFKTLLQSIARNEYAGFVQLEWKDFSPYIKR